MNTSRWLANGLVILALVLASLGFAARPRPALACSCTFQDNLDLLSEYDAVFEGRVIRVGPEPGYRVAVTYEVVRMWKGPAVSEISIEVGFGSCGAAGAVGQLMPVNARFFESKYATTICDTGSYRPEKIWPPLRLAWLPEDDPGFIAEMATWAGADPSDPGPAAPSSPAPGPRDGPWTPWLALVLGALLSVAAGAVAVRRARS